MTDLRRTVALLVGATATLLGGCASTMSGLGGEGSYACKAPVGSQCTSVSGVYANSIHGQPPASALPKPAKAPASAAAAAATAASASTAPPGLGAPPSALRSQPRVLRLWIAPWEDADGDLHEASVVHVLVDTGRWLIERVIPANRQRVDAVRPPIPSTAPASAPSPASEPASSTEAAPDRFPSRTGLLPGNGVTQEP
jgi:conjugal transfer pilus assembly protein TraV